MFYYTVRGFCSPLCAASEFKERPKEEPVVTRRKNKWVKGPPKKRDKKKRPDRDLYDTQKWRELRYQVFLRYGRECMLCGTTKGDMHVDHIKPKSRYPNLSLAFSNLQVLCRECNLGKSNLNDTDFRPVKESIDKIDKI